jgi:hypothetical protein
MKHLCGKLKFLQNSKFNVKKSGFGGSGFPIFQNPSQNQVWQCPLIFPPGESQLL